MSKFNPHIKSRLSTKVRSLMSLSYYVDGIEKGDQFILSEAITLLESKQKRHRDLAYEILLQCESGKSDSLRLGITGSPGVGKSTFIEFFGLKLQQDGYKVAVLSIDPSSANHKGSILGDKTRMERLSKQGDVYIRPSPSSMHLGGSHQYSSEAILMCEAAGFNRIIVETVGVGQSEIEVAEITDANVLLLLSGAGDSLQGVKMGVMEAADLIIIHKADGENQSKAKRRRNEIREALHILNRDEVEVVCFSSLYPDAVDTLEVKYNKVLERLAHTKKDRRSQQKKKWLQNRINQFLIEQVSNQLEPSLSNLISSYQESSLSQINSYLRVSNSIHIAANISDEAE